MWAGETWRHRSNTATDPTSKNSAEEPIISQTRLKNRSGTGDIYRARDTPLKNVAQRSPRMILNKDKVQTRVGNIAYCLSKK